MRHDIYIRILLTDDYVRTFMSSVSLTTFGKTSIHISIPIYTRLLGTQTLLFYLSMYNLVKLYIIYIGISSCKLHLPVQSHLSYSDSVVLEGVCNLELSITQKCIENTVYMYFFATCITTPTFSNLFGKMALKAVWLREVSVT